MPLAPSPANDQVGEIKYSFLAATIPNPSLSHVLTVPELTLCTWLTSQPGTETGNVPETPSGLGFPICPIFPWRTEGILVGQGVSCASLKLVNAKIWKLTLSARSLLVFMAERDQTHNGHALLIDVTSSVLQTPCCHSYHAVITGDNFQRALQQPRPHTTLRAGMLPWEMGPAEPGGHRAVWRGPAQHPASSIGRRAEVWWSCCPGQQETHLESNGKPRDRCQSDKALCSAVICFPVVLHW